VYLRDPFKYFQMTQHTVLPTAEQILKLATTRHLERTPHCKQNLPPENVWGDALCHYYPIIFIAQ